MSEKIYVLGAGLAGVEAAWQIAKRNCKVILFEKRPKKSTPAHRTPYFAELVCSNSFKSKEITHPHGLLKEELRRLGSIVIEAAFKFSLPGGKALTVDREEFSKYLTEIIEHHPNVEVKREEVTRIPDDGIVIVATGPLTEGEIADEIKKLTGSEFFYFYDALSPIVSGDSLDMSKLFFKDRHGLDDEGYLNSIMDYEEYTIFWKELVNGEIHRPHDFEREVNFFEGCLPIEEMARRGFDTLRYGPLRPDGIKDPKTGKTPFACVQLRREDLEGKSFSLVGFQTQLKIKEQERIFRMIKGLQRAEFLRYGAVHRNSYILGPKLLNPDLSLKKERRIYFAGQISGTEGYTEAVASGLVAGLNAYFYLKHKRTIVFPKETSVGALINYITSSDPKRFSPMNINLSLYPGIDAIKNRKKKMEFVAQRSLKVLEDFVKNDLKL
ncbi:MAG: methylenetetrahydrofolate--tRNA-(uracil(54)-C(5))-methyltransferase (FADH(2)-oxidizing) TrmFO [Candidatus Hydrothermales bacterium]